MSGSQPDTPLKHLLGRGAPRSPERDSLEAWGRAVGAALPTPSVLTFDGELGTGKTTLVRAICAGFGVTDLGAVTSPTFSLVQQYESPRGLVVHTDLYRLRSRAELDGLGWDELVQSAAVMLIEWPERAAGTLPSDAIAITLAHDPSDSERRVLRVAAPAVR